MRRIAIALVTAAAMIATPAMAAAPCKDAKGKFIKCPEAKPVAKAKPRTAARAAPKMVSKAGRCRDAKGRFAKCGTPGAHPA